MIGKIVRALILIPLAIILVAFALANRQATLVSFDPFDAANPAFSLTLPLFVLILALLILGVILGGAAAWMRQNKWRRAARTHEAEARRLQMEVDALKSRYGADPADTAPPRRPHLTIPPPAA